MSIKDELDAVVKAADAESKNIVINEIVSTMYAYIGLLSSFLFLSLPNLCFSPSLLLLLILTSCHFSVVSTKSILAELEVLQRQLNKTERYANEISEHKDMSQASGTRIKAEVKVFVKTYKEKVETLDEKGRRMMSTYSKILVSYFTFVHYNHHVISSLKEKFGEKPSTDSEDLFAWVAVFIRHFQRIHKELYPPPKPSPNTQRHRLVVQCNL